MWPPSWLNPNGTIGLSSEEFYVGQYERSPVMWFTNWTFIPGDPTLDPALYTLPDFHGNASPIWEKIHRFSEDHGGTSIVAWLPTYLDKNPWLAPGTAEVFSPCGIAGGNPFGVEGCDDFQNDKFCTWGGYSYGPDARDIDWEDSVWTEWSRGESVRVGWSMDANHGGGYSYRLCKVGVDGPGGVTEECFQKTPLQFSSEYSWVQYGNDENRKVVFKANRTTHGTYPPGSEWTMNPIPVCNSTDIGWLNPNCPQGFEFPPRGTGLHGVGEAVWAPDVALFLWILMDEVTVPGNLESGEYVLSFRWDNEATPQVWSGCSNIMIT